MSDQTAILCIGGPLNGHLIADNRLGNTMMVGVRNSAKTLRAADLPNPPATTLYRRMCLAGERCTFTIWRHESLTPDAVLRLLLTSYQLNAEKEPHHE
jgi:hypothetical protein